MLQFHGTATLLARKDFPLRGAWIFYMMYGCITIPRDQFETGQDKNNYTEGFIKNRRRFFLTLHAAGYLPFKICFGRFAM
jgi:hypothetical protein